MSPPRVGIVQLWQEVNTYSPRRTTKAEFEAMELAYGRAILDRHRGSRSVIAGFLDAPDLNLCPLFSAAAWPGGPADADTADWLLGELRASLARTPRLDGLLLDLHGAMAYEGKPDMELEAVLVVREVLGTLPIACVLDLHGIPSPDFVADAAVVIGYGTYPHVDMFERGREAASLMTTHLNETPLRSAIAKIPLLTTPLAQATGEEPMKGLMATASRTAEAAGLTRISLLPGFPYSDVSRAGFSVVGVAPADLGSVLERTVDEIADEVSSRAAQFELSRPSPAAAVKQARASENHPVVVADIADNVGGGGAGDGTALLAQLLDQDIAGALVTIADAEVAQQAADVGPGGRLDVHIGGKRDRFHGDPLRIQADVEAISDGHYRAKGTYMTGKEFDMGTTAHLKVDGLDLVVSERPVPPFHAEQITHLGIDPTAATVITAKGAVAWRSAFGDVAEDVIEADTPGVTPLRPETLPRGSVPMAVSASALPTPVFEETSLPLALVREPALTHNINAFAEYCRRRELELAPHVKTTMSEGVFERQERAGAWGATVATAAQAAKVVDWGVRRILVANQVVDAASIEWMLRACEGAPDREIFSWVDSSEGLAFIRQAHRHVDAQRPAKILLELGYVGGRSGLRSRGRALELAVEAAASDRIELCGIAAFEGTLAGGEDARMQVDRLLAAVVDLFADLRERGLLDLHPAVLTVGGSAYFDRVASSFADLPREEARVVLRSGCYVTHDCGIYDQLSPLGSGGADVLRPALEVWGAVVSVPEPGLAIANLGRRDVSFDAGLPKVKSAYRGGRAVISQDGNGSASGIEIFELNDHHAYVRDAESVLRVGDALGVCISHPCTTFDKWRELQLVDDEYRRIGVLTTEF